MAQRTCSVEDCERAGRLTRGWCHFHYQRWWKGLPLDASHRLDHSRSCGVEGCDGRFYARGYCQRHYLRVKKHGEPGGLTKAGETGRHNDAAGYVVVRAPSHPLARNDGWVREHRLVLYNKIGPGVHPCHWCGRLVSWERTYPRHADGLVVDHLDDLKANNEPFNLVPSCNPCNSARGVSEASLAALAAGRQIRLRQEIAGCPATRSPSQSSSSASCSCWE